MSFHDRIVLRLADARNRNDRNDNDDEVEGLKLAKEGCKAQGLVQSE